MSWDPHRYEAACLDAAERQGLVPVLEALTLAGIDHSLEQTGGMTMVVTVRHPDGIVFALTESDEEDGFLLGTYSQAGWDDGEVEDHNYLDGLSVDRVLAHLREVLP